MCYLQRAHLEHSVSFSNPQFLDGGLQRDQGEEGLTAAEVSHLSYQKLSLL